MQNLFTVALEQESVDEAIAPIMSAVGITHGDVAAQTLTQEFWALCSRNERRGLLAQWLANEITYS